MQIGIDPEKINELWWEMTSFHKKGLDVNDPIYELIRELGYYDYSKIDTNNATNWKRWTYTLSTSKLIKFYSKLLQIKKQRGY